MKHPICGFEHLHRHGSYSLLDGYALVDEYAEYSKEVNQKYLCISDHGTMATVPSQIKAAEEHNLIPIYACEMYINPMQMKTEYREESATFRKSLPEDQQKKFDKSMHLLAIAISDVGYSNLVKLTSWGWIHGFYRKPRINHEVLQKYKEGLIFTSTCGNSEIAYNFFNYGDEAGFEVVKKYHEWFGENFYLELMMLDWKMQKPYNEFLIRAHNKFNIPFIISQDCHFCKKEHSKNQRLTLMINNKRTLADIQKFIDSGEGEELFELQDTNLWMKSEEELDQKWESDFQDSIDYEIYKQAKANTVKICQLAQNVKIDRTLKIPTFPDDKSKLLDLITKGIQERNMPKTKEYLSRIKEEYEVICDKGFASYFLMDRMMVEEAFRVCKEIYGFEDSSIARGGRGSVGGSLVAYLLDLHDLDPVKHDLYFSRFLSRARGGKQMKWKVPDDLIITP